MSMIAQVIAGFSEFYRERMKTCQILIKTKFTSISIQQIGDLHGLELLLGFHGIPESTKTLTGFIGENPGRDPPEDSSVVKEVGQVGRLLAIHLGSEDND